MIRADVDVADLDPDQWAWLSAAVVQARHERRWGYVLHADGRVLSTHPDLQTVAPGSVVDDPAQLAVAMLVGDDVSRAVVIDRAGLPDLAREAAALVEPGGALTDYRERVEDLYWKSPAVVTAPAPPANVWRGFRGLVEAVADGVLIAAVTDSAQTITVAVALHIRAGAVVRITSPAAATVEELATPGATLLTLTDADLARVLRSESMAADLLACARRTGSDTDVMTVAGAGR